MAYTETESEDYTFFTDKEEKLIDNWLKERGYSWNRVTVCGSCCGMYEDCYWGIGKENVKFGKADKEAFKKYALENNIGAVISYDDIQAVDNDS